MKAYDWHVVPSTHKAGRRKTPEALKAFEEHYKTKYHYDTEEEMIAAYRKGDVKVCLHPWPASPTIEGFREASDYVAELLQKYPDVIWAAALGMVPDVQPGSDAAIAEVERYTKKGFAFVTVSGTFANRPLNDKSFYLLYEWCVGHKVPVIMMTGSTGSGAGLRGGGGLHIGYDHPMYIDIVAMDFPSLNIIVSRPAWPWQDEMLAVIEHKGNILGNELHGWSPKYFTPSLKQRLNTIMQDKFMFGSDYPIFSYERLFRDWDIEGYKAEVLEKVFIKNSLRIFDQLGIKG